MAYCPQGAIEAGHSWGIILYLVTSLPAAAFVFGLLGPASPFLESIDGIWTRRVIRLVYTYASLFLCYAVFNLAVRIPVINTLFTWTTLTRLYRRYHEPDTSAKDLV
jgi:hypothetical protein